MNFGKTFMKSNSLKWWSAVLVLGTSLSAVPAQETNEGEQLRQKLREMRKHMQQLEQKLESLEQKKTEAAAPPGAPTAEQLKELNEKINAVVEAQTKVRPGE